jgi:ESF2/ABP1 family protein
MCPAAVLESAYAAQALKWDCRRCRASLEMPPSEEPGALGALPEMAAAPASGAVKPETGRRHSKPSKEASSKSKPRPGVIYLSRVPPGLDVGIVRSILGRVGPLGRVWLRAESKETVSARRSLGGRRRAGFTDGWVEFVRAADAEAAVELLNGRPMTGATRRGRFQNDLWCLKMLPGFRWDDLVDESCGTRRERVLRVKSEVAAARRERAFVEQRAALARTIARNENRRRAEGDKGGGGSGDGGGEDGGCRDGKAGGDEVEQRMVRRYRQKRPLRDAAADDCAGAAEDGERHALQRLERETTGDGSAVDGDLIAKLFKRRRTGGN